MPDIYNTPALPGGNPTMSSREIAELTGKQHKHVLTDIRKMLGDLKIQPAEFSARYLDAKGEARECYDLPKRESLILVSGYSVELRAKIIDRWAELERQVATFDPVAVLGDPAAMRGLLLTYTEKVIALETRVEADKPKTNFYDQYVNTDGLYGLQNAGRALGAHPNKFTAWLKKDYLFYQGTALVPRVRFIQMGVFEVKSEIVDEKARYRTFVTAKGLSYLSQRLPDALKLHPGDGEAA